MKQKILSSILTLFTLFTLSVLPSYASATFESNDSVSITSKITDDLYAAGGDIRIGATVNGDLITAGGNINIEKNIQGDVMAAGGNIIINGNVSDDIRIAGGNLEIHGRVQDDVIAAGGKVIIGPQADIFGDLHVGTGELIIKGRVRGKVTGAAGSVMIEGRVDKDVELTIDQELKFIGEGFVKGNLNYSAWKPLGIPRERIGGELIYSKIINEENSKQYLRNKVQNAIFTILAFLILGTVLLKLLPKYNENFVEIYQKSFWKNLLTGIIWLILAPIVAVLLCITVIGIPLAIIIFSTYLIMIIAAYTLSAFWIGTMIYKPKKLTNWNRIGQLLLGLIIISSLCWVPVVGWLIVLILFITGTGTMINAIRKNTTKKKSVKKRKK